MIRMKRVFAAMGVQGSNLSLQNKHAMTASILVEDNGQHNSLVLESKAANQKLLKSVLPHISDNDAMTGLMTVVCC